MKRYIRFGRWFQRERLRRGFKSGRALSLAAHLSSAYVSDIEAGKARPRGATVDRLAEAMNMTPAERAELRRRALLAGESGDVISALPSLAVWRHLSVSLLEEVQHNETPLFDLIADDLLVDLVRGLGPLVAWLGLLSKPPTQSENARLRTATQRIFQESLRLRGRASALAARDAISELPRAWRKEVFARRQRTARLVAMLREWAYLPRGFAGVAQLSARLKNGRLDQVYSFSLAPIEMLISVHDAMIAHRLWTELDLTVAFGVPAESAQGWDLANQLRAYPITIPEAIILATARGCRLSEEVQGWTNKE